VAGDEGEHLVVVELLVVGVDAGVDDGRHEVVRRVGADVAAVLAVQICVVAARLGDAERRLRRVVEGVHIGVLGDLGDADQRRQRLDLALRHGRREAVHDRQPGLELEAADRALDRVGALARQGALRLDDHADRLVRVHRVELGGEIVEDFVAVQVGVGRLEGADRKAERADLLGAGRAGDEQPQRGEHDNAEKTPPHCSVISRSSEKTKPHIRCLLQRLDVDHGDVRRLRRHNDDRRHSDRLRGRRLALSGERPGREHPGESENQQDPGDTT
jgi:hypothetical protein